MMNVICGAQFHSLRECRKSMPQTMQKFRQLAVKADRDQSDLKPESKSLLIPMLDIFIQSEPAKGNTAKEVMERMQHATNKRENNIGRPRRRRGHRTTSTLSALGSLSSSSTHRPPRRT